MLSAQEESFNKINNLMNSGKAAYLDALAGIGKSYLIKKLIKSNESRIFLNLDNFGGELFPDIFAYLLSLLPNEDDSNFIETFFNLNRSKELLKSDNNLIKAFSIKFNDISELDLSNFNEETVKFIQNYKQICFESFIIDIINYQIKLNKKLSFTLIFDNVDHIINLISDNLIHFLDDISANNYKFIFYSQDDNFNHNEFLDINYIFSTRSKIHHNSITIKTPDNLEIIEILEANGYEFNEAENLSDKFFNCPFILFYQLKYPETDILNIYIEYVNHLFKYSNNEEVSIISQTAYFNEFEENILLLNSSIFKNVDYTYLLNLDSFYKQEEGLLKLNSFYKNIIYNTIRLSEPDTHNSFQRFSEIYQSVLPIIKNYGKDYFNVLRKLSYFDSFELNDEVLSSSNISLKQSDYLLKNHMELFDKNKHTYKVKDDYKKVISEFNKFADLKEYDSKIDAIKKLWQDQKNELENAKKDNLEELANLEKHIIELSSAVKKYSELIENQKRDILSLENDIKEFEKKKEPFVHKQPVLLTLILFFYTVIGAFFGFFHHYLFDISSDVLLIIMEIVAYSSITIFIYNILPLRRIIIRKTKKDKLYKIENEISELKTKASKMLKECETVEADRSASEIKLEELQADTVLYKKKINLLDEKLKEPYVEI